MSRKETLHGVYGVSRAERSRGQIRQGAHLGRLCHSQESNGKYA